MGKSSSTFEFPVDVLKTTDTNKVYLPKDRSIIEHAEGSTSSSQNQVYEASDEELEVDFFAGKCQYEKNI